MTWKLKNQRLDAFTIGYLTAALWSEVDDNGTPLDSNYSHHEWSEDALEKAVLECAEFQRVHADIDDTDSSQAGHDFWLTRCGHGAGFWDGDWPEPGASVLTAYCKRVGERNVVVGDDGQLYFYPGR